MARQITFAEFRQKLESRWMKSEDIEDYLEIDPTSPRIRVRFRPGVLKDLPPDDYDVDHALYLYQQALDRSREKRKIRAAKTRVVAEGDSWFRLPVFIRPKAIATRIEENERFLVRNIAKWGDTLREILAAQEYLKAIKGFLPTWFIFSGGGNDLQEALAGGGFLFDYDPARPLKDSITPEGQALFNQIATGYETLLREVRERYPDLRVLCFGYDYPRPEVGDGKYIGRYLRKQGYPPQTMRPLVEIILDRLNEVIKNSASSSPTARFINCLHVTDPFTWFDDMHPDNDGFESLAKKFEAQMKASIRRARKKSRR